MHGELLKLGINVSQATVAKYIVEHRKPPSHTWRTFLENHLSPYVERLIGSIRRECLGHMVVVNEGSLRRQIASYIEYYHQSRSH